MLKAGLVSITFRQLKVEEIIKLVIKAGLQGIEWGGDIHVPHGDIKKACKVAKLSEGEGLEVAAYGSYYRVGCNNHKIGLFENVLETAVALGAPTIRVWAGDRASNKTNKDWCKRVIEESRRIATMAENENIAIAYEYHDDTLTDTNGSALRLMDLVKHPNVFLYWQPPHYLTVEERCQDLKNILPWLKNIHVFYWIHASEWKRLPLEEARKEWLKYFELIARSKDDRYAMLEFVNGDSPEQFLIDSKTLKNMLKKVND